MIIGLCGSGKSYYAENSIPSIRLFEGIKGKEDKGEMIISDIINHLKQGKDCAIEEIYCCFACYRDNLIKNIKEGVPEIRIEYVVFEKDLYSANWNVIHRPKKRKPKDHIKINKDFVTNYIYPNGTKPISIKRLEHIEPCRLCKRWLNQIK